MYRCLFIRASFNMFSEPSSPTYTYKTVEPI